MKSTEGSQDYWTERRRLPRLGLTKEQFRLGNNGKIFSVTDLSSGGMALRILDREDLRNFSIGAELEGNLNLKGQKHPIRARVRHIKGELVGCQFEEIPPQIKSVLKGFLDPVSLGRELRPIPVSEEHALWYHGPSGTDVMIWRKPKGGYLRVLILSTGDYVQWEEQTGLVTGQSRPGEQESESWGIVRLETMLLDRDAKPDPEKLSIAKTLILSSKLPKDLLTWCVKQLKA
ncbi:MAG: PilZ domain-containing protein [Bdellovibrionota bacterium]